LGINVIVSNAASFSPHSALFMTMKCAARMLAPSPGSGALWLANFFENPFPGDSLT
jgi:hypothetical protein